MKSASYTLPILLFLTACASGVTSQREVAIDGNSLQVTSGTMHAGRYITVENVARRWEGRLKGGKEKWGARTVLLEAESQKEIRNICGAWFYHTIRAPVYKMMDKDETMGGMAPVLGITASMLAHLAAESATDPANVPVSIYTEFSCPKDDQSH